VAGFAARPRRAVAGAAQAGKRILLFPG